MAADTLNITKPVLTVGLACVDIINVTDRFPEEDTDSR